MTKTYTYDSYGNLTAIKIGGQPTQPSRLCRRRRQLIRLCLSKEIEKGSFWQSSISQTTVRKQATIVILIQLTGLMMKTIQ